MQSPNTAAPPSTATNTAYPLPLAHPRPTRPRRCADSDENNSESIEQRHESAYTPPTPRATPQPFQTRVGSPPPPGSSHRGDERCFMLVPPEEDPLSLLASPHALETPHSTGTRAFFDRFVHDAKAASEQNRKSVVDEILWRAREQESREHGEAQDVQEALNTSLLYHDDDDEEEEEEEKEEEEEDHTPNLRLHPRSASHSPSSSSRASHSPKLSPPTLAPPLLVMTEPDIPERPPRHRRWPSWTSNSTTTSSSSSEPSLSSSWSSSLSSKLKSTPKHEQTRSPSSTAQHTSPSLRGHSSSSSTSTATTATTATTAVSITHDTPFASHVFPAPISGAPAFMAERYDWDRGFSNELMREMEGVREAPGGRNNNSPTPPHPPAPRRVMEWEWERDREREDGGEERKGRRAESVVRRIRSKIEEKMGGGTTKRARSVSSRRSRDQDKENEGVGVGEFMEKKSGSVTLEGRKEGTVPVLDVRLADMLRPHLPALDRLPRTWHLIYSLDQHGISLNTLYARCEAHTQARVQAQARLGTSFRGHASTTTTTTTISTVGMGRPGMVLVLKDEGDTLFGVWMEEGIRQSRGKGYYGTGDSFMWRYRVPDAGEESSSSGRSLSVFKWTGMNKYVALCEPEYVSFGGGDGRYGLYLDETLLDGTSARCATFENEPLCSPGPDKGGAIAFECVGLEVWGVGP